MHAVPEIIDGLAAVLPPWDAIRKTCLCRVLSGTASSFKGQNRRIDNPAMERRLAAAESAAESARAELLVATERAESAQLDAERYHQLLASSKVQQWHCTALHCPSVLPGIDSACCILLDSHPGNRHCKICIAPLLTWAAHVP